MKFKNLYPNVEVGYKSEDYPGVKKVKYKVTCYFCGAQTDWYDVLTHQYCCKATCLEYTRKKEWFK